MPEKKRNIEKIMSLVFLVIAAVGIGVTGASISHRMELTNQIRTPTVSVEVREEVGSVEEGLKTKKVKFENTGNADVFLRVSYGETWTYQEGEQRMILPNEPEGKEAAVKNWNTDGSWQEGGDGWFYYTRVLKPKESTPYILTAVDFRRTAELSDQRYRTAGYELYFRTETVQASDQLEAALDAVGAVFETSFQVKDQRLTTELWKSSKDSLLLDWRGGN